MFTNTDFLNIGNKWVPSNSTFAERQTNYINGRNLYEGKFENVFKDVWAKIATRYGKSLQEIEQVMIKLNLFRTLTETFKIIAFQKEPEIWVGEGKEAQRIDKYFKKSKVLKLLKQGFISAHCQGDGVFKVYTKTNGEIDISVVNPEMWISIHNPDNLNEIIAHVVASAYEVNNDVNVFGKTFAKKIDRYLNVEIHYKGYYENRIYKLDSFDIIKELINTETVETGYSGFLVFPFNYGCPCWRDWGVSQYADIIPIIDELIVRRSDNSKILDDHADPQLIATEGMLDFDTNTGQKVYHRHNAVMYDRNGKAPAYLTWDGNLSSSEDQIKGMMDLFYTISGTNPQMFGQNISGNLSGEALAKILLIPIAKTKEMVLSLEDAFEDALSCLLQLKGINKTVDIQFNVGAFNSTEDIVNRVVKEKNADITSLQRAVEEINPRYSKDEVQSEIKQIQLDKKEQSVINLEDLYPKDDER